MLRKVLETRNMIQRVIEGCGLFQTLRPKCGSSSRKEEHPVTAPVDRPILVLKAAIRPR